eukprot:EG_transcript_2897
MGYRVSFTFVLTLLTLILSLAPAVIIWVVFMDLMTASVDLLRGTTHDSTERMAQRMQEMLIYQAMDKLESRLREGESELQVMLSVIYASGLLAHDLRPSTFDFADVVAALGSESFAVMSGHSYFSGVSINGALRQNTSGTRALRTFALSCSSLYIDVYRQTLGNRTLYGATWLMQPDEATTIFDITYLDQLTGRPMLTLQESTSNASAYPTVMAPNGWDTNLGFNPYSGQIELGLWHWLPAQNNSWVQASIDLNAQTISAELAAELVGAPADRLVMFFTQPHGHMIAASHGKFYSQSDVDRRFVNPLTNPLNLSAYYLYTCLDSNDALIQQACQQLYGQYKSWTAIPTLEEELLLVGQRYWVAVDHTTSSLKCTVLMLKNRAAEMGRIDASNAVVDEQVAQKKGVTFVILGVVTAVAILLPLGFGLWLAARLYRLAAGMDEIAKLQFNVDHAPPTLFSELHRFQVSFIQMERGLQAFGKFVPQAVVKVLMAGKMQASNHMSSQDLTIMFADIEGFSAICEAVSPPELVTVCTEYFEVMCAIIIDHHGTIDKFIGDCIMALWNAPEPLPGHELDAVGAALVMQEAVLHLHAGWRGRGLPLLRFRLGVHSGPALVGNFGCSYRVSYTCLGDSVNLAARLEALNKKFGTSICVSHTVFNSCRGRFHFRRLAKVTVPGKAEVLPVYEALCAVTEVDDVGSPTLKDADLPGLASGRHLHMSGFAASFRSFVMSPHHRGSPLNLPPVAAVAPEAPMANYLDSRSVTDAHSEGSDNATAELVVYHWTHVEKATLLEQAALYEAAYEALLDNNITSAQQILQAEPLLGIPDPAWAVMAEQARRHDPAKPWDGVLYFREK